MSFLVNLIIRSPWGLQALLCAAAVLLIACIGLGVTVEILGVRLDAAQARQAALADRIATQNQAITAWKAEADKQAQRVREAARKAEKVRTVTALRVRTISVAAIPTACPDAVTWGAKHALEFNKRWEEKEDQDEN